MKMGSDTDIPCSTCRLWNTEKKSFSCNPNTCKKLSDWLLKHTRENVVEPQDKIVQYVV
jgi:hypothetical protein